MAQYVNVGAATPDGTRIKTKAELKRLLLGGKVRSENVPATPSEVMFDSTAAMGPGERTYRGDDLPVEYTLQVVGPDPYTDRRWYASVSRDADGKITVK